MQRLHEWKADILTLRDPAVKRRGVSRGHSKPATSCRQIKLAKAEASHKDEGLNVRKAAEIKMLMVKATTTETL